MKRDIHHHFIPAILQRYVQPLPRWNVKESIAYLKEHEYDKATLSVSNYDIEFKTKEEYVQFCHDVNRELNVIIQDNPDHFDGFGLLPFPYIDECIEELTNCVHYYFSGIILYTNVKGTYPSTIHHEKLFSVFNAKQVILFIHPGSTPPVNGKTYKGISDFIEYPLDVTRLIARFFAEDGFERFPHISYVLSHAGGIFPYQFSRIGKLVYFKSVKEILKMRWGRIIGDLIKKKSRVLDYLNSMEFDLYGFTSPQQLAALHTNVKTDKCYMGSNFPYEHC